MPSGWERRLQWECELAGLPVPLLEQRFHPVRKWRLDLCWPDRKLAAEIDGGVWTRGRHTRGNGFEKDCEKVNAAVLAGFRVLRFSVGMVKSGAALQTLEAALRGRDTASES